MSARTVFVIFNNDQPLCACFTESGADTEVARRIIEARAQGESARHYFHWKDVPLTDDAARALQTIDAELTKDVPRPMVMVPTLAEGVDYIVRRVHDEFICEILTYGKIEELYRGMP